MTHVLPKQLI